MMTTYERIAESIKAKQTLKAAPYVVFSEVSKKLMIGTQSLHRTPSAHMLRTFYRIKCVGRISYS